MTRPRCRRCGKLLSLCGDTDIDTGEHKTVFTCDFQTPDAEFWERWNNLPGDDVVRLERQITELQLA
jgi:hypothetical protein